LNRYTEFYNQRSIQIGVRDSTLNRIAKLRFHQRTFALLGHQPATSDALQDKLADVERALGRPLPASVREWYSLAGATSLLAEFSNDDHIVPLEQLTGCESIDAIDDVIAPGRNQAHVLMHENQGVCTWAVLIDGSDDPAVVVCDNHYLNPRWHLYSDRFSTFVYVRIWDFIGWRNVTDEADALCADTELTAETLSFLRTHFLEEPQTLAWPGDITYRFSGPAQHITIWASHEGEGNWWLWGESNEDLFNLACIVLQVPGLRMTISSVGDGGRHVLTRLRSMGLVDE
jgi:hypothetical protein